MAYFLRFTPDKYLDLERGTSFLDLPSMAEPELMDCLCGYKVADDEEVEWGDFDFSEVAKNYIRNSNYSGLGECVIFKGTRYYGDNEVFVDGECFTPISIHMTI